MVLVVGIGLGFEGGHSPKTACVPVVCNGQYQPQSSTGTDNHAMAQGAAAITALLLPLLLVAMWSKRPHSFTQANAVVRI